MVQIGLATLVGKVVSPKRHRSPFHVLIAEMLEASARQEAPARWTSAGEAACVTLELGASRLHDTPSAA